MTAIPGPLTAFESQICRKFKYGDSPTATDTYHAVNAPLRSDAILAVSAVCPAAMLVGGNLLYVENYDGRETAPGVFDVDVQYSTNKAQEEGDWTVSFDFTSGTQNIRHAREHITTQVRAGEAAGNYDHGGLINVDKDGNVKGCDIVVPQAKFHVQAAMNGTTFANQILTEPAALATYKRNVLKLIGTVNNAAYKGAAMGELLLTGVQGKRSKRNPNVYDLSFQWAFSENVEDFTVLDLPVHRKEGWWYVWTESEQVISSAGGRLNSKLQAYHLERVYEYGDFTLLGLGP